MSRQPRNVLVTGATAGIGEACARRFAAEGDRLVLWARRADRLERLARALPADEPRVDVVDVRDRPAVEHAAAALERDGVEVDVLINNAGLSVGMDAVFEGAPEDWERMIDTNVKGLLWVTRALLPGMVARNRGHIVNLGSTAGHWVYPKGNVYNATKYAVRALTEAINVDLVGTAIRVTSIDPGFVETEFSLVRFKGDAERARSVYQGFQPLRPDDVADAVAYAVNAPPHVDVFQMILMPTAQRNPYVLHRD
ncbi:MAG: SDR family NAD(P)-dependent oxidoreductase [Longimicrobiales bacterium]